MLQFGITFMLKKDDRPLITPYPAEIKGGGVMLHGSTWHEGVHHTFRLDLLPCEKHIEAVRQLLTALEKQAKNA